MIRPYIADLLQSQNTSHEKPRGQMPGHRAAFHFVRVVMTETLRRQMPTRHINCLQKYWFVEFKGLHDATVARTWPRMSTPWLAWKVSASAVNSHFVIHFDDYRTSRHSDSILLWLPYVIGQVIIFLSCGFYLSFFFFFFFSSPNLSVRRLDVYHTSTHGVALVRNCEFRMQVWNVLHAAHWKYRTQKIAILASSHNFVGLYLRN